MTLDNMPWRHIYLSHNFRAFLTLSTQSVEELYIVKSRDRVGEASWVRRWSSYGTGSCGHTGPAH